MRRTIEAGKHCSTKELCTGCVWRGENSCISCVEKFAREIVKMSADLDEDDSVAIMASRHCAENRSCAGCIFEEFSMRDCLKKLSTKLVRMDEERR